MAAVHQEERWFMVRDLRVHRANHAYIVDRVSQFGEDFTDLDAALAAAAEGEGRAEQIAGLALTLQVAARDGLAAVLLQHRFGIESVHLRGTAVEKEKDDVFGRSLEVRGFGSHGRVRDGRGLCPGALRAENTGESGHAEAGPHGAEYLPSRWRKDHLVLSLVEIGELIGTQQDLGILGPRAGVSGDEFVSKPALFSRGIALEHEAVSGRNALVVVRCIRRQREPSGRWTDR